jgi:hypothetical protein
MEIKRYSSICLLVREMKKDLFNIDLNNPPDEKSFLSHQIVNLNFSSDYEKININKRKKIN